ncbi:tetraspanin-36-like isoform X1 [Cygnus atratus]|uniref:tetraspanin-36-like isoform X1 n=1 Tax=Cygnus atratus TaxID=8868 RepID=UPI0015D61046|nr:tetraspanin-36-like isoform X1 [Cygnus atratus]
MDCGVITSKSVLLLLSLAFWAAAAGLSYVGGYVMNTYRSYDNFLQDKHALLPAVIILCVAAVMFIIGLLGCCATFRESRVGLGLFLAIILIIFIAEVSAFVLAFVYREKVKTDVQGTMRSVFEKYDGKNSESAVVDYLQENLHCCGVKNYSDWTSTQWFNSTGNNSVPLSCCKQNLKNCTGSLDQPQELNTQVRIKGVVAHFHVPLAPKPSLCLSNSGCLSRSSDVLLPSKGQGEKPCPAELPLICFRSSLSCQGCSGELESGLQSVISYAMLVILGFAIVKFFGMLSVCVLTCKREDSGYQPLYSGVFA